MSLNFDYFNDSRVSHIYSVGISLPPVKCDDQRLLVIEVCGDYGLGQSIPNMENNVQQKNN